MPRKKKEEVIDAVIVEEKSPKKKTSKPKEQPEPTKVEVVETNQEQDKPYFFPRLVAYIIDILLVSVVCSFVMLIIPENKNYQKYMDEYEQIQTNFIAEKITAEEYISQSSSVVYDIDYSNVLSMILEVVLIILYFIVFQFYNKGQTLGKKLMKLRLISAKDSELTLNQVALHALIINSILINILVIGSLLFLGRNYYYYASSFLQFIAIIIVLTTLFMILFRKDGRGLHDLLAGTKVVQEK